jgi:spermidine/putrescine transport system ATP-binding protein
MEPILEVRDLIKDYPGQRALADISRSIPRGSFFSLLGPSGCGKTTTLRLIAGFEEPTSGDILIKGEVVNRRRHYERNVSTVFQNYALFPHLSARQTLSLVSGATAQFISTVALKKRSSLSDSWAR